MAQHNLAVLYERGKGVGQDLGVAFDFYSQAARQGYPASQYNLAALYALGRGVAKDLDAALHWFCEAGRRGFENAAEMVLRVQQEIDEAKRHGAYTPRTDNQGKATPESPAEAPKELLAAYVLRQRTTPAKEELVNGLRKCIRSHYNPQAVDAFLAAKACVPVKDGGLLFSTSLAKPGDVRKKMDGYIRATGNEQFLDFPGRYEIDYYQTSSGQPPEPSCIALVFGPDPEEFDPHLIDAASIYMRDGDFQNAARLLRRGAEQGIAQAQYNLGVLLYQGSGVAKDFAQAIQWFRRAAAQDYANAVYMLAFMCENGYGCVRDLPTALDLYKRAAALEEPDSQCKLAQLLLDATLQEKAGVAFRSQGWDFVAADHAEAKRLLHEACNRDHQYSQDILAQLDWAWPPLRVLARRHIDKMRDLFSRHSNQFLDLSYGRWTGLFDPAVWNPTEAEANRLHERARAAGTVESARFVESGPKGRVVLVTVVAKNDIEALKRSFPGADYCQLYRNERRRFREIDDWVSRDFVHWMFLWDEDNVGLHLLYQISLDTLLYMIGRQIEQLQKKGEREPYRVELPPRIMPESLVPVAAFQAVAEELFQEERRIC